MDITTFIRCHASRWLNDFTIKEIASEMFVGTILLGVIGGIAFLGYMFISGSIIIWGWKCLAVFPVLLLIWRIGVNLRIYAQSR